MEFIEKLPFWLRWIVALPVAFIGSALFCWIVNCFDKYPYYDVIAKLFIFYAVFFYLLYVIIPRFKKIYICLISIILIIVSIIFLSWIYSIIIILSVIFILILFKSI